MKNENSKLLLGLGLGAIVGVAVGYLLTGENRRKVEEDLREVGHGIKDGAKSVFSKVKSKAEKAGSKFAGKTGEWSEKAADKAEGGGPPRADLQSVHDDAGPAGKVHEARRVRVHAHRRVDSRQPARRGDRAVQQREGRRVLLPAQHARGRRGHHADERRHGDHLRLRLEPAGGA